MPYSLVGAEGLGISQVGDYLKRLMGMSSRQRLLEAHDAPMQNTGLREMIDARLAGRPTAGSNYWDNLLGSISRGSAPAGAHLQRGGTQMSDLEGGYQKAVTEYGGDPRAEENWAARIEGAGDRPLDIQEQRYVQRTQDFLNRARQYAGEARGWKDGGENIPIEGRGPNEELGMIGGFDPRRLRRLYGMSGGW